MRKHSFTEENHAAGKVRNANSRTIFKDPVLCAQFLRYLDMPELNEVRPEDIEDVSEVYQAYLGIEFEADTINKIHLRSAKKTKKEQGDSLYLISLVEHKSRVDYNVSMQLLKYMACIWNEYAKEMEQKKEGCTRRKEFRYPPILPIVYYEGSRNWTADLHLKDRVWMGEEFKDYLPNFRYHVVRLHDYSDEDLLAHGDAMSLIMMINKIQNAEDFKRFRQSPPEQMDEILKNTTENIRDIIKNVMYGLLMKMSVPVDEARQYVEMMEECHMGELFENFEKIDIQAERRNTEEARKDATEARKDATEARKEAAKAKENLIKSCVSLCQEFGSTRETAIEKLMEKCGLSRKQAEEKVNLYWHS